MTPKLQALKDALKQFAEPEEPDTETRELFA